MLAMMQNAMASTMFGGQGDRPMVVPGHIPDGQIQQNTNEMRVGGLNGSALEMVKSVSKNTSGGEPQHLLPRTGDASAVAESCLRQRDLSVLPSLESLLSASISSQQHQRATKAHSNSVLSSKVVLPKPLSAKRVVKSSGSPSSGSPSSAALIKTTRKKRKRACGECAGCMIKNDCGKCKYCKDKPKFGGPNRLKKKCEIRKCRNLIFGSRPTSNPTRKGGTVASVAQLTQAERRQRGDATLENGKTSHYKTSPSLTQQAAARNGEKHIICPVCNRPIGGGKADYTTHVNACKLRRRKEIMSMRSKRRKTSRIGECSLKPDPVVRASSSSRSEKSIGSASTTTNTAVAVSHATRPSTTPPTTNPSKDRGARNVVETSKKMDTRSMGDTKAGDISDTAHDVKLSKEEGGDSLKSTARHAVVRRYYRKVNVMPGECPLCFAMNSVGSKECKMCLTVLPKVKSKDMSVDQKSPTEV